MIKVEISEDIIKLHKDSLLPKVQRRLERKIESCGNEEVKVFYEYLLDEENNHQILKDVLVGKPHKIRGLINFINNNFQNIFQPFMDKDFKKDLESIFSYTSFRNEYDGWGAYKLTKLLDINTCPYCNRQYTHTYYSDTKKTRPELDHYYPQYKYPFIGLSLYNLIPSCHICNSNLKFKDDFYNDLHVHPYEEGFEEDAVFRTDFVKDEDGLYDIDLVDKNRTIDDFKLHLLIDEESALRDKIINSNNTFLIEELYQKHKDYVIEIIRKSVIYNKKKIDELYSDFGNLFGSKSQLIDSLIGNYIQNKDLKKRVLSKLTKDIWDEYGLKEIWKQ